MTNISPFGAAGRTPSFLRAGPGDDDDDDETPIGDPPDDDDGDVDEDDEDDGEEPLQVRSRTSV